jgi:lactose PTS system EIIA component
MQMENSNMVNYDMEQICFQIIAHSGEAFSKLIEAVKICRAKDYAKANELMQEASGLLNQAHQFHTELLVGEAQGNKIEYSVLLAHAQDNLMNTMLAKTLFEEMIDMYKELKG